MRESRENYVGKWREKNLATKSPYIIMRDLGPILIDKRLLGIAHTWPMTKSYKDNVNDYNPQIESFHVEVSTYTKKESPWGLYPQHHPFSSIFI